jgi:hypothetical protein
MNNEEVKFFGHKYPERYHTSRIDCTRTTIALSDVRFEKIHPLKFGIKKNKN